MDPGSRSGGGAGWRSEEDYVLARLAVAMGLLDPQAVGPALGIQGQAFAAGQPVSLSQVLVRERRLTPEGLLQLKAELARCLRACPGCGQARYLAAGPQHREEPCGRCGAAIPVPPTGSSLTTSAVQRREAAFRQSAATSRRFERDPFVAQGGAPRVFSHYVIEAQLAKGGMGAVYRARHAGTGRVVALKVVLAGERATEAQLHRFRREARAQAELDHPNVLKIHEAGEWEGILYYTMDLIEGPDLARAFPDMELPERARVLALVARAVHHAHAHGYVHRDLKPANVMLDPRGEPLVTDFGLAKNLGGETKLTSEGSVLGTPFYMSPEQATGQTELIGPRSDVYALGVLLYELATGALPFHSDTAVELYRKIIEETPRPFAERGVLEPALEQIAFKAMAKAPEDRYESAEALAIDLERWRRGEAPLAQQVSRTALVARQVQRHKRSIGALLGMLTAGLVVMVGLALAVRLAVRRHGAEQVRIAWHDAATHASTALELARAGPEPDEDAPDPARAAALDLALEQARAARDATPPPGADPAPLDAALALGLLQRAEHGLAERTAAGAAVARRCAREALTRGADAGAAHLLLARAARRLGALDEASAAVSLAAAHAPAQAALLQALVALDGAAAQAPPAPTALEQALAGLSRVAPGTLGRDALLALRCARGRALAVLGRDEEARAAFEEALAGAPTKHGGHRRVAEAWLLAGRDQEAAAHLARALALEPQHAPTASALVSLLLGQGRPLEALRVVEPAAGRAAGTSALQVELLRARLQAGHADAAVVAALEALAAAQPAAALLLADLAAVVRLEDGPEDGPGRDVYDALAAGDPIARAARARARAARGDAAGAREELAALSVGGHDPEDAPHDVPPTAAQVRRARDVGFALLALGDAPGAARAARAALRGAPADPEATLLLVQAEAASPDALRAAFRRELEQLEGPLGRAVLLARLAAHWGRPDLAPAARALSRARLAGQPGLGPPLRHEAQHLAHALGDRPEAPPELPAPWTALLPPRVVRPTISDAARAEAVALVTSSDAFSREENEKAMPLVERAVALDPEGRGANWEYATRFARQTDYSPEAFVAWTRYLRVDPAFTFGFLLRTRHDVLDAFVYRRLDPAKLAAEALEPAPDDPVRRVLWIVVHQLGLLFPADAQPAWPRVAPEEVRAALDRAVLEDPGLVGLLYLRAQLMVLGGRREAARRDLLLASSVSRRAPDGSSDTLLYDDLCRLGVLAQVDVREALKIAEEMPRTAALGKRQATRMSEWLGEAPWLAPLRGAPAFKKLVAEFSPR